MRVCRIRGTPRNKEPRRGPQPSGDPRGDGRDPPPIGQGEGRDVDRRAGTEAGETTRQRGPTDMTER